MSFTIQDTLLTNTDSPVPSAIIKATPDSQQLYTSEVGGVFHPLEDPTRTVTTANDGTFTLPLPKPSQSFPSTVKWYVALPATTAFPLGATIYGAVPESDGNFTMYSLLNAHDWAFVQNITTIPIVVQGPPGPSGIPGNVYSATASGGFPQRPAANAVGATPTNRVAIIEADDNQLQISDGTNWRDALGNVIA